ncbi:hypothetical protein C4D60_Mb05t24750 [Musa balbisiana]|uniref:Uncharacterized protein n=1 Tax=Musa balbisiana TaxID=52838 RepID=A0A4S8JYL0_MUSBA|nr:hypothetical protein C4D60_Mb05t24750 [Musa balbisiana]
MGDKYDEGERDNRVNGLPGQNPAGYSCNVAGYVPATTSEEQEEMHRVSEIAKEEKGELIVEAGWKGGVKII